MFFRLLFACLLLPLTLWAAPAQPKPPTVKYAYSTVSVTVAATGRQGAAVFYPLGVAPEKQLPLILFLHGWGAVNPQVYGGWISHLARQGNVVVFPYYQNSLQTPPAEITANAQEGVRSALAWLQSPAAPVRVNTAQTAAVGHSMGGVIAVNYAALAQAHGLPQPKAVLAVQPGKTWGRDAARTIPLADLNTLNPQSLLVTLAGEDDKLVRDTDARKIISNAGGLAKSRKAALLLGSDAHGKPPLIANHVAPVAAAPTKALARVMAAGRGASPGLPEPENPLLKPAAADALDTYGLWRTFDLLRQSAFKGQTLKELAKNPQWLNLGKWSDKRAVKPLKPL